MIPFDEPVLRVGDRVTVECPAVPELCVERTIGPDGTIALPRLGALSAAIRPTSQLARAIEARLLIPVEVFIKVRPPRDRVTISGAVTHPLDLFAPRGMGRDRLLEAAHATAGADLTLVPARVRVAPGTLVVVPEIDAVRRISILGAVVEPRALPPSNGYTLARALESAGGLSGHADAAHIVVERNGEPIPVQMPLDAEFRLVPGDVVTVGLVAQRRYVAVRGSVVRPGTIEYAPGMTATRALAAAGGLLPSARTGTLVWQTGAKEYRLSIAFLLERRIPDPVLGPEDTLLVEDRKP